MFFFSSFLGVAFHAGDESTLHAKGAKLVPLCSFGSQTSCTYDAMVFSDGTLAPAQILFKGKTPRSFPTNFRSLPPLTTCIPTAKAYSTFASKDAFVENVIIPAFNIQRELHGLSKDDYGLLLIDNHSTNFSKKSFVMLYQNRIIIIFIPPGMTQDLQIIDIDFSRPCKKCLDNYL